MRLLLLAIGFILTGCGDTALPPPRVGVQNWRPRGIGGPIEVRPLPLAERVMADYEQWIKSDAMEKARVYETVLCCASNQLNFRVVTRRESTPMGRPDHTYVSFYYKDPTNVTYEFLWDRLGRHTGDYLRLTNAPKIVWITVSSTNEQGVPRLEIEAFEGLEPGAGVIAQRGRKAKIE